MFISGDYILGRERMGLELSPLLAWAGIKNQFMGSGRRYILAALKPR